MLKATVSAAARGAGRAAWLSRLRSLSDVRYLALISAAATYALIILGGTVRATDSGLACPDWPRCLLDTAFAIVIIGTRVWWRLAICSPGGHLSSHV